MRAQPLDDGVGEIAFPLNVNYGNHRIPRVAFTIFKYSLMQINRLTLITYPIRVTEKILALPCVPYENRFLLADGLLFLHCLSRLTVMYLLRDVEKKRIKQNINGFWRDLRTNSPCS